MSKVTVQQIRAARGLLGWTQSALAARSGVAQRTISLMETEMRPPSRRTVDALRSTLESAGVRWTEAGGVEPVRESAD